MISGGRSLTFEDAFINDNFGFIEGLMTTIHAATSNQQVVDATCNVACVSSIITGGIVSVPSPWPNESGILHDRNIAEKTTKIKKI